MKIKIEKVYIFEPNKSRPKGIPFSKEKYCLSYRDLIEMSISNCIFLHFTKAQLQQNRWFF